jgi:hypothetical protein
MCRANILPAAHGAERQAGPVQLRWRLRGRGWWRTLHGTILPRGTPFLPLLGTLAVVLTCNAAVRMLLAPQCGSACQEAKTAEACCEACMTWAAANSSCKSWFFRGNDKQCMLKGCTSYAECLGQVTPTEDYTSGLGPCLAPAWGWPIVIVLLVASTLYVGGGLVYNVRAKGMAPGPEALPHLDFWHEVRALVEDGASFTATRLKDASGRGAGGEYAALGEAHPPLPVQTGEGGGAIADSGPAAAAAAAAAAGSGGGSSASEDEDSLVE